MPLLNVGLCSILNNSFCSFYRETNNLNQNCKLIANRNSLETRRRCSYDVHDANVPHVSLDRRIIIRENASYLNYVYFDLLLYRNSLLTVFRSSYDVLIVRIYHVQYEHHMNSLTMFI